MGLYAHAVFPLLCDLSMSASRISDVRRSLLGPITGEVIEIGFGTGLNLPHYSSRVRRLVGVDVNPGMSERAERRAATAPFTVERHTLSGERLPMADASFDAAVCTWTLCSIETVDSALTEIRRVLRPQGRLYFAEHGTSPSARVRRWQRRLTPVQRWLADGCRLDRDIPALIRSAGFSIVELHTFDLAGAPRTHGHFYVGVAVPVIADA